MQRCRNGALHKTSISISYGIRKSERAKLTRLVYDMVVKTE
jgi:hypothetical protein